MKKVGKLFEELGFNKEASDSVKKAFVKHLIFEARRQEKLRPKSKLPHKESLQMSFDLDQVTECNNKKIS